MNKQREEFEEYMKNNHPFINSKSDAYLAMWNIWQASSIPEGYVVVPKEPSSETIIEMKDIWWKSKSAHLMKTETALSLYKAMIEAVEKNDE